MGESGEAPWLLLPKRGGFPPQFGDGTRIGGSRRDTCVILWSLVILDNFPLKTRTKSELWSQ